MRTRLFLTTLLFFGLMSRAQLSFGPPTTYTVGQYPADVASADFNNDGYQDIVTGNLIGNVTLLLGSASGSMMNVGNFPFIVDVRDIACADINNDGGMDVVGTGYSPSGFVGRIGVLYGDGYGNFGSPLVITTGNVLKHVAAADVNGDFFPDIVTADGASPYQLSVYLNNQVGGFHNPTAVALKEAANDITAVDFNKNGYPDVAVTYNNYNQVGVFMSNGQGGFSSSLAYSTGQDPWGIVHADFNEDGLMDLATANGYGNVSNNVTILPGNGAGVFNTKATYTLENVYCRYVVAGDFDRDGHQDLVTDGIAVNRLVAVCGDGSGSFGPSSSFVCGSSPDRISSGDYDKDGRLDVVTIVDQSGDNNTIKVMLNMTDITSVNEYAGQGHPAFYPNPARQGLVVRAEPGSLLIIKTVRGEVVLTERMDAGSLWISCGALAPGVYFATCSAGSRCITGKLVVAPD